MQTNVDQIVNAAGQVAAINKATGRHFKELPDRAFMALLVLRRQFKPNDVANTQTTNYDGYWHYPTVIYGKSNARDHQDFTDYSEVEQTMNDFLTILLQAPEWEIEDLNYYEATLSGKEIVAAEVELKKFDTRRF